MRYAVNVADMQSARHRILLPYTQRVDDTAHRIRRVILFAGLILFAMILGFLFAVLPLAGIFIPLIPIIIMFLLVLWMAPDIDSQLDKILISGYLFFILTAGIWPRYISLNIQGLPWISFQRIVMFGLLIIGLYALATSSRMRGELSEVLRSHKFIFMLFVFWVGIQALMLGVAGFSTVSRWVHYQIMWSYMFVLSAWIFYKPGAAFATYRLILVTIAITAIFALLELVNDAPIWAGHVPNFLGVDPSLLEIAFSTQARGTDGIYRARSIYVNSVTYAEFIAVLLPFVLHAILVARNGAHRAGAFALLALLVTAAVLTSSRTAMVGLVLGIPAMAFIWVGRRYRTHAGQRDLIAPATLALYPIALMMVIGAVLFVGRVRIKVLGSGAHQASNDGRRAQWDMALPKIFENPFGYGIDKLGEVVPYTNLAGQATVDSYPINLLIEHGVLGFLVFVGLFATSLYLGVKVYWRAQGDEELLAGPAAMALLGFMVSRMVISAEGTQYLAFAFSGMILALYWRQEQRLKSST